MQTILGLKEFDTPLIFAAEYLCFSPFDKDVE